MHWIPWSSRLVFALVATFVYLAVLATGGWLALQAGATQPQRPAPDAKVRVVKAPAEPVVDRMPTCPACEMGGPGRRI
jgi:hypothetical protein